MPKQIVLIKVVQVLFVVSIFFSCGMSSAFAQVASSSSSTATTTTSGIPSFPPVQSTASAPSQLHASFSSLSSNAIAPTDATSPVTDTFDNWNSGWSVALNSSYTSPLQVTDSSQCYKGLCIQSQPGTNFFIIKKGTPVSTGSISIWAKKLNAWTVEKILFRHLGSSTNTDDCRNIGADQVFYINFGTNNDNVWGQTIFKWQPDGLGNLQFQYSLTNGATWSDWITSYA